MTDSVLGTLRSVLTGAYYYISGKIFTQILGFASSIILTRYLGVSIYGIYALAMNIVSTVRLFSDVGANKSIIRYYPQAVSNNERRGIITLSMLASIFGAFLVSSILFISAPLISEYSINSHLLITLLRVFSIYIITDTLTMNIVAILQSMENIRKREFINHLLMPLLRFISIVGSVFVGFSLYGISAGIVVSSIFTFSIAIILIRTETIFVFTLPNINKIREYIKSSLYLVLKDAGSSMYVRVDVLMVGFLLTSSSAVGGYNVAVILSMILSLPIDGISQLFPPIASGLYSDDKFDELEEIYSIVTRWGISISLLLGSGMVVYSGPILSIFGGSFTGFSDVLFVLVLARISNNFTGPSGQVLLISGNEKILLINQWIMGISNILLNYLLISEFGILGAAFSTLITMSLLNVARIVEVHNYVGLSPFDTSIYKPILGTVTAIPPMVIVSIILEGIVSAIIGGLVGFVCFMVTLYVLGFDKRDIQLAKTIVQS